MSAVAALAFRWAADSSAPCEAATSVRVAREPLEDPARNGEALSTANDAPMRDGIKAIVRKMRSTIKAVATGCTSEVPLALHARHFRCTPGHGPALSRIRPEVT